jgi:hypothetical protein
LTEAVATPAAPRTSRAGDGLAVGPFFLIAALSVAIAAFLLLRGQPLAALALVALTLIGAGLAAAAVYRTVAPLALEDVGEPTLLAGRTRAALERDKALTLRAIKELEFDQAMGKVSNDDFVEMRDRLRARAVRLMAQLDGAALYRAQIEEDLQRSVRREADRTPLSAPSSCATCGTVNDADARFCKSCGTALESA